MKTQFLTGPSVLLLAVLAGCDTSREKDPDTSRPSHFGFQTGVASSLVEEGKLTYERYCIGCHGVTGDGNGDAAGYLHPRPRNFVTAQFKFSSTRSGQLPTDEDLRRTLRRGLRGSAMPSFGLLPARQIDGLVAYIKTFSPLWQEREPASAIPLVDDPYRINPDKSEAVQRGEAVYHGFSTCWTCHPAYVPEAQINKFFVQFGSSARDSFRPHLDQPVAKPNEEGQLVYPPDFLRDFVRAGSDIEDLYRSISAGITGTAMPTWVDSIELPPDKPGEKPIVSRADLWAMAYYVQSLIARRPALLEEGRFAVRDRPRPIYLHSPPPPVTPAEDEEPAAAPGTSEPSSQPADESFNP